MSWQRGSLAARATPEPKYPDMAGQLRPLRWTVSLVF